MLANFDELNVITSQGGGGGGGGGTDFGSLFKEVEIPRWMQEWKPLIEAILGGTLGAIILPKIFDWVSKIVGLLTGSKISDVFDFLKRYLFGNGKDDDGIDLDFDLDVKFPDIASETVKMGLYAGAVEAAKLALEGLKTTLIKVKSAMETISLFSTLLNTILSVVGSTLGGSIKLSVDRKEFDEFEKEFEQFKKDNTTHLVSVMFDHARSSDFWRDKKTIDDWCKAVDTKAIAFMTDHVRSSDYTKDRKNLDEWLAKTGIKEIAFVVDHTRSSDFWKDKKAVDTWTAERQTKKIDIMLIDNANGINQVNDWIKNRETKTIDISVNTNKNDNNNGNFFDRNIFTVSVNDALDYFNNDLPTIVNDFWDSLKRTFGFNSGDDVVIDIGDIFTVKDEGNAFAKEVQLALVQSGKTALSANEMKKLKTKFPTIKAIDVFNITNFGALTTKEQNDFLSSLMSAFGADGINAIRQKIPNISAPNIMKIVDWNTFTTEQRFEFLNAIKGAFGSKEAIAAARKAGIDIGDLVQQGMQSKDSTIRKQAEEWDKIINDELKSAHTIAVQMSSSAVSSAAAYVKNTIEALNPSVTATAKYASGYPQNLKTDAEAQKPKLSATVVLANGAAKAVQDTVGAIEATINATINAENVSSFASAIKKALTTTIQIKLQESADIIAKVALVAKAEGGLVKSGDLFLANENGTSEMIGKFGNNTAVANQEQMVEAMARGVQYANEEQNSLLRRQNELLMGILQKDTSLRLGASSALGRIARQSLDMYETATGV